MTTIRTARRTGCPGSVTRPPGRVTDATQSSWPRCAVSDIFHVDRKSVV